MSFIQAHATCDNRECNRSPLSAASGEPIYDGWFSVNKSHDGKVVEITCFNYLAAKDGADTFCSTECLAKRIGSILLTIHGQDAIQLLKQAAQH